MKPYDHSLNSHCINSHRNHEISSVKYQFVISTSSQYIVQMRTYDGYFNDIDLIRILHVKYCLYFPYKQMTTQCQQQFSCEL